MKTPEETIARSLEPTIWDQENDQHLRETYLGDARDVVEALGAAGYMIVPREPTEAMVLAGADHVNALDREFLHVPLRRRAKDAYHAMLAAAPNAKKPPQPEG